MMSITVKPPKLPPPAPPAPDAAAAVFGPITWIPGMYGYDVGPSNHVGDTVIYGVVASAYAIETAICPGAVAWRFEPDSSEFSMMAANGAMKLQGWVSGEQCLCYAVSANGDELGPIVYTVDGGS